MASHKALPIIESVDGGRRQIRSSWVNDYPQVVAGYGTILTAPDWSDELVRLLLWAARRRADRLETLEMRFGRRAVADGESEWTIEVDGNGTLIAAWSQQLERDLPIVAEGYRGEIGTTQAVRIARSIVARWFELIVPDDHSTRDPYRIRTSVSDPILFAWTVIDWPEDTFSERFLLSDELVARWLTEDLPAEVAVEEIHTMAERALRSVTASGQQVSFPELIKRAEQGSLLRSEHAATLRSFNQARRKLKHRGHDISSTSERNEIDQLLKDAMWALDALVSTPNV